MKTSSHSTTSQFQPGNGYSVIQSIDFTNASLAKKYHVGSPASIKPLWQSDRGKYQLLTEEASVEIARGDIPDLEMVCRDLQYKFLWQKAPYSPIHAISVIQKLMNVNPVEMNRFLKNPKTSHVLVKNDFMKVVLIHWKPGAQSSIHGHPEGGGIIKVLKGSIVEDRYSPNQLQRHLGTSTMRKGDIAYIDDQLAYHTVGNPSEESAVSLHVYARNNK